jgi:hypothetical protein
MWAKINGFKTYIVSAIGVLLYGLEAMGYIPKGTADKVMPLLGFLGLATLRHAVAKVDAPVQKD